MPIEREEQGGRTDDDRSDGIRTVRLVWGPTGDIETLYANQLFVVNAGPQFYLVFGEVCVPPRLDGHPVIDELEIRPVARIAVAPDAMVEFRRAIDSNVDKYEGRLNEDDDVS